MSLWARFMGREQRSARESIGARDPYLAEWFGMRGLIGGVTPDSVLSNLAVAARCVALRSELLASVGLFLFRRTEDGGRDRAADDPLYGVLHDNFNPQLTAFEGREFLIRCLDLTGNAYAGIEHDGRGRVVALYPYPSGWVEIDKLTSGRLRYKISDPNGGTAILLQEEMLHIRGPSREGITGLSPIQIARGSLALAMAHQETALSLSGNSLRPGGLLSYPERLTDPQRSDIRRTVNERYAGAGNAGKFMLLDGGVKYEKLAFSPEDAEFLDSRKLGNEDVARIFGLPPTSVGITDKATYSNTEQEARALVQNALGPLGKRIEAAMGRCLLTETGRQSLYVEHDLDSLLRGDVAARFEAYRIGREIGALSPNDIRRRENEPPIANGNTYHQPANWVPLGTMPAAQPQQRGEARAFDEDQPRDEKGRWSKAAAIGGKVAKAAAIGAATGALGSVVSAGLSKDAAATLGRAAAKGALGRALGTVGGSGLTAKLARGAAQGAITGAVGAAASKAPARTIGQVALKAALNGAIGAGKAHAVSSLALRLFGFNVLPAWGALILLSNMRSKRSFPPATPEAIDEFLSLLDDEQTKQLAQDIADNLGEADQQRLVAALDAQPETVQ